MEPQRVMVSVAVITYNMERYLRPLLDSILKQKVSFPFEIVIDDDCSPDNSRDIIKEYVQRYPDIVHPIYRDTNVGGSRNMFGVMQKCTGKYIAILEGDDCWEAEDKLQYQVDFLESHPEYIAMTCNSWCERGERFEYSQLMRTRHSPKVFSFQNFKAAHFHERLPSSTDTWIFRNFWHDGGDYSLFYKSHRMVWDQALILILYGKGNVYADTRVLSHHRSISSDIGTNYQSVIRQSNVLYDDSRMYKQMEEYIRTELHEDCGDFYKARVEVWIDSFFRALKSRKTEDWVISFRIWNEQKRKGLLVKRLAEKNLEIIKRKMRIAK